MKSPKVNLASEYVPTDFKDQSFFNLEGTAERRYNVAKPRTIVEDFRKVSPARSNEMGPHDGRTRKSKSPTKQWRRLTPDDFLRQARLAGSYLDDFGKKNGPHPRRVAPTQPDRVIQSMKHSPHIYRPARVHFSRNRINRELPMRLLRIDCGGNERYTVDCSERDSGYLVCGMPSRTALRSDWGRLRF
jgi:hypothetical protein